MSSSSDTSYNLYDKPTSIDWNGQHFILTVRNEITGNTFAYAYSVDGVTWATSPFYSNVTTQNPYTIKYLGDKFVAVGNLVASAVGNTTQNCLIDIVDGEFPVAFPTNLTTNTIMYDIEQNVEQSHRVVFPKTVVLSLGNNIAYSIDQGHTWLSAANSVFSDSANDAVWNGRGWVACGTGTANTIATSLDGIHWLGRGNSVFSTTCNGIDWSPQQKKYVAVGSGTNIVATSMDGIYWRGTNTTLFSIGNDIKWNGVVWVAVGSNSPSVGNTIAYSYDAVSWQYASISFQTSGLRVYYDEESSGWIAYGSDPSYNIATSADGINWTLSYSATATKLALNMPRGLFADPSLNLYPGIPYPLYNTASSINKYTHNHSDRGCAYIQPISIACGSGSCVLAYSMDGIQWSAINTSLFTQCNKAIWNGILWVVVGEGEYWVATSPDGLNWTGRDSIKMTECYDIAWNGNCFVAVGIAGGNAALATSPDGITWTSVTSISTIFSTNIHAIEWTGKVWLAYGSGTNTTAISSSLDASVWTSTPVKNLCITDSSNILLSNITSTTASSVKDASGVAANAFDGSTTTKWSSSSSPSNYDTSGNYIGTTSATQGISGEWLQVQLTSSLSCANYYLVFSIADGSAIPQSWTFLGSNNGTDWTVLDTFAYGTNVPPNNSWKYPFVCLPLAIQPELIAAYSYYRIVFTKSFGEAYVSVAGLALFDGGASSHSDIYIRPIVLKDLILHPTRILSIDGGAVPNIYRITDLSCNLIRSNIVHNGQYVNNIIYGLTSQPSAIVFDGVHHVVASSVGEVSYLSNTASNTNLNFDTSMNGAAITGITGTIVAGCYNRKFILLGSSYGTLNEYVTPTFYPNNLSSLFTTINGLASNSGYGFVVSPNTLCLGEDERLSVVTPKFYDAALSSGTSLSFNVYKSEYNVII